MRKIRTLLVVIMMVSMLAVLSGCGKKTIDGNWILFERQWGDGYFQVQSSLMEEFGYYEEYYIEGDSGHTSGTNGGEEFYYDFTVNELGNGSYEFLYEDGSFETVTLKDGWLYVFVPAEDEDSHDYTYAFVREDDEFWDEYNNL